MKKRTILPENIQPVLYPVAIGVVTAIVMTILGCVINASMIHGGTLGENSAQFISMIVWFVSTIVGTMISGKLSVTNMVLTMALVAVIYFLILMSTKVILFSQPYSAMGKGIGVIAAGLIPGLLYSIKGKVNKKPKFKYRP